jgi:1-deoxy-D-xylulose-5-phosphate reductoisomerase
MKKISLLGCTGSIGKSTLDVVRRFPERFRVVGLGAGKNIDLLQEQIQEFKAEVVAVFDEEKAEELRKKNLPVNVVSGMAGMVEVARLPEVDTVVSAIVGSSGLMPTFEAIKAKKNVALANKEALVMAGSLMMNEALKRGVNILPVDSEHSAIFQCLNGGRHQDVRKIILTASGGPFINKSFSELEHVTPEQALKHPNWSMGRKITIDSATLMNKALEVIEARWLFDIQPEKIAVLVHPQSIVHSMVEYVDGSIIAQMSIPDMKGPICYALSYPERLGDVMPSLNMASAGNLTFHHPDLKKYPSLLFAFDALSVNGTMPSVLNASNEVAVEAFLGRKIAFLDIFTVVREIMDVHQPQPCTSLDHVISAAQWAKQESQKRIDNIINKKA